MTTSDRDCPHVPPPGQVHCCLCHTDMDPAAIEDHARLLHPAQWGDGLERWPDGRPVVYDTTLEPEDFR